MDFLKYKLIGILLISSLIGWFIKSEDVNTFNKERLLSKSEKIKYLKYPKKK